MDTDTSRQQVEGHVPVLATAGTRLLDKFSSQWEHLHRVSEKNVRKSKLALNELANLDQACRARLEAMDSFVSSYKSLSEVEQQIANIGLDLSNLESSFIQIENCLTVLAERNERASCDSFIRDYTGNHEARMQSERIRSELKRDQLMADHLQRVQDFEKQQQLELDERRKVLASEFETEKSRYMDRIQSDLERNKRNK